LISIFEFAQEKNTVKTEKRLKLTKKNKTARPKNKKKPSKNKKKNKNDLANRIPILQTLITPFKVILFIKLM